LAILKKKGEEAMDYHTHFHSHEKDGMQKGKQSERFTERMKTIRATKGICFS